MRRVALAAVVAVLATGCRDPSASPPAAPRALKLWHTFNTAEAGALNELLEERERAGEAPVEVTLLPFARAMTILADVLAAGERCPDLVRIDATWLPGLASRELLQRAPEELAGGREWLPEADELARAGGTPYALPQALDGLALVHRVGAFRGAALPWPPETLQELENAASRLTAEARHGLALRADGYWYAAFLRALGGRFPSPEEGRLGVDEPVAAEALTRMGALYADGIAPPPAPGGEEAPALARQFREGRVAVVLEGPWLARDLAGPGGVDALGVVPFPEGPDGPAAPRGAQLLAVPTCAAAPEEAWKLARALTDPELQAAWARRFGTVPTTRAGLADAGSFSRAFYRALERAAPLPRHPVTAELFDDLTPAVRAVAYGDATAEEALAGVRRGWGRVFERHGIRPIPPRDAGADAGPEAP